MSIKVLLLTILLSITVLLSSCISGGTGSSSFDIGKFLSNPIVMIAIAGIVIWMAMKKKK